MAKKKQPSEKKKATKTEATSRKVDTDPDRLLKEAEWFDLKAQEIKGFAQKLAKRNPSTVPVDSYGNLYLGHKRIEKWLKQVRGEVG